MFNVRAEVDEFVGTRLVIEPAEWTHLGEGYSTLGKAALLGRSIFSVQDKIRIRIFVRDLAQYLRFLPSGDLCEPLADLVFFYNGDQLDWEYGIGDPIGSRRADQARPLRAAWLDKLDGAELDFIGRIPPRCAVSSCRAHAAQARVRAPRRRLRSVEKGKAMADISLEAVAGKLNRVGYEAFFKALRPAKGAGNRNVELAHWLVHILQGERSDIALTADHFKLDRGKLMTDVTAVVNGFRKNETEMPAASNTVIDMLDRGWHYATLFFGETQIRTGHILVGAVAIARTHARAHQCLAGIRQDIGQCSYRRVPQDLGDVGRGKPASDGRIGAGCCRFAGRRAGRGA